MQGRFRIETVKIRGFRCFPEQAGWKTLSLAAPCTVIYGVQGGGKSSTLHAVAWCLFGRQIANKTATGIQERKNWMIHNQRSQDAWVQVVLVRGSERIRIERCTSKQGDVPAFSFTRTGAGTSTDEQELHKLLGIELGDYMSGVHLHQEMISGLMLQDPADRKESFERLLGLSDLQNFHEGLKKTRLSSIQKDLQHQWQLVTQKLQNHLELRTLDLEQAQREARRFGLPRVEREDIFQRCTALLDGLHSFGPIPETLEKKLQPKFMDTDRGLSRFLEATKNTLLWLQEKQPLLQRERALQADKEQWLKVQQKLDNMHDFVSQLHTEIQKFRAEHDIPASWTFSATPDLTAEVTQRSVVTGQTEWEKATLHYLEHRNSHSASDSVENTSSGTPTDSTITSDSMERCPLCQSASFDVQNTLAWLRTKYRNPSDNTNKLIENSADSAEQMLQKKQFLALKDKWNRTCQRVFVVLPEQIQAMMMLLPRLPDDHLQQQLQALFAEFVETSAKGEPLILVERYIAQVANVVGQYPTWIEQIQQEAAQAQNQFRRWEQEVEALSQAQVVLDLVEEVEDLQQLQKSEDLRHSQTQLQHVYDYIKQIHDLQEITGKLLQDMAGKKLGLVREQIRQIYRQLSSRTDYPDIMVDVEKFEVMATNGHQEETALRFFNKGDINCAALSIFLALASGPLLNHHLGFILLDDPSQHSDLSHKQKLARVLAELQKERQVVIATAEPDFLKLLQEAMPGTLQVYNISGWHPEQGPLWSPPLA